MLLKILKIKNYWGLEISTILEKTYTLILLFSVSFFNIFELLRIQFSILSFENVQREIVRNARL